MTCWDQAQFQRFIVLSTTLVFSMKKGSGNECQYGGCGLEMSSPLISTCLTGPGPRGLS